MKIYTLTRTQFVPKPLYKVFGFFSKPENLEILTPDNIRFQILTPSPLMMKEGSVLDYAITIFGLPVRWTTMITQYDSPHTFVDIQLHGPYSYWHHTHTFTETLGGTIIQDTVKYSLPFGFIGVLAHGVVIRRQLENIFTHRGEIIDTIFSDVNGVTDKAHPSNIELEHI